MLQCFVQQRLSNKELMSAVETVVQTGNIPKKIQGQALFFAAKVHRPSLGVEITQMQV